MGAAAPPLHQLQRRFGPSLGARGSRIRDRRRIERPGFRRLRLRAIGHALAPRHRPRDPDRAAHRAARARTGQQLRRGRRRARGQHGRGRGAPRRARRDAYARRAQDRRDRLQLRRRHPPALDAGGGARAGVHRHRAPPAPSFARKATTSSGCAGKAGNVDGDVYGCYTLAGRRTAAATSTAWASQRQRRGGRGRRLQPRPATST